MIRKEVTARTMGRTDFIHVMEVKILLNHGVVFGFQLTVPL